MNDNPHVIKIHGATITHDFIGLEAHAVYGEQTAAFTSRLNEQTGFSVEPSALQQAIAWAKELSKAELAEAAEAKRQRIKERVEAAKEGRQPEIKKPPAASEGTT